MKARIGLSLAATIGAAWLLSGCERTPVDVVQRGYRGVAMGEVYNPRTEAVLAAANQVPAAVSPEPGNEGPLATSAYRNVQVLNDLSVAQFTRLMLAMTQWVAPQGQTCNYCHSADLSSDDNYRKVVARQMLRMVRHINSDWKDHVGTTGVTCYTCHRGQDLPANVWYNDPGPPNPSAMAGNKAGQNAPADSVGLTSLPNDPFTPFLDAKPANIRVQALTPLPDGDRSSIKQAEWTYGLMIHMSKSLGVNCTYCHNSRAFEMWDQSTPQRATAWYGIRMVRDANTSYLAPLASIFPADRKGALGDVAKINCATCHQGVYKPLYGTSMLKDYPELLGKSAERSDAVAEGAVSK